MRSQTPLAPSEPAFDVTVYIVLNDFGPLGRAYVETDETQADEATVIDNILRGEYSCPLRVVAFNTAEGWARDVTEDIARAVLNRARGEGSFNNSRAGFFGEGARSGCAFGRLTVLECAAPE